MPASVAAALSLVDGETVQLKQNGYSVSLPVRTDDDVPEGCVWVPGGLPETAGLGALYGAIEVSRS